MTIVGKDWLRLNVRAGAGGNGMAKYNGVGGDGGDVYLHARKEIDFNSVLKQLDNADAQRLRAESGTAAT